jgi:hypothetical protein
MISEKTCFVYMVLPGETKFVTAARFQISITRNGVFLGELIYGKKYMSRMDAVELDPVELQLGQQRYQTTRMNGFFGAIRDAMPDYWGRRVIEYNYEGRPAPAVDNAIDSWYLREFSCKINDIMRNFTGKFRGASLILQVISCY